MKGNWGRLMYGKVYCPLLPLLCLAPNCSHKTVIDAVDKYLVSALTFALRTQLWCSYIYSGAHPLCTADCSHASAVCVAWLFPSTRWSLGTSAKFCAT